MIMLPENKSVLITGTSSGIGEACALELHERGFRVFAGVRREEDGQRLVSQSSDRLVPVRLDITNQEDIERATETIQLQNEGTGLYGLVNNAGYAFACPLEFIPIEKLRHQLEVNLIGQVALTQAMLPMLRASKGRIVNVNSLSGYVAGPYVGPYAASKHAFNAVSDSFRLELRNLGVKVIQIIPGDIKTPIWEKSKNTAQGLRDEIADEIGERLPQDVRDCYANDVKAMTAATTRFAEKALPVTRVVNAVSHSLCSRRPKSRYVVGARAWGAVRLLRFLPDGWRDWIILNNVGMS